MHTHTYQPTSRLRICRSPSLFSNYSVCLAQCRSVFFGELIFRAWASILFRLHAAFSGSGEVHCDSEAFCALDKSDDAVEKMFWNMFWNMDSRWCSEHARTFHHNKKENTMNQNSKNTTPVWFDTLNATYTFVHLSRVWSCFTVHCDDFLLYSGYLS